MWTKLEFNQIASVCDHDSKLEDILSGMGRSVFLRISLSLTTPIKDEEIMTIARDQRSTTVGNLRNRVIILKKILLNPQKVRLY